MVDARLPDGSRVNAIIEPLALDGPTLTIRKFGKHRMSPDDLVNIGAIERPMLDFLRAAVEARLNVVICGGTGSGKTTFLNVLSSFIPDGERIVTIEDAAELRLDQSHIVRLEARPANLQGAGEIRIRDLVRNALRMRPDRIIVGECRGGEALDMLQAMNTGHDGSLTTHARQQRARRHLAHRDDGHDGRLRPADPRHPRADRRRGRHRRPHLAHARRQPQGDRHQRGRRPGRRDRDDAGDRALPAARPGQEQQGRRRVRVHRRAAGVPATASREFGVSFDIRSLGEMAAPRSTVPRHGSGAGTLRDRPRRRRRDRAGAGLVLAAHHRAAGAAWSRSTASRSSRPTCGCRARSCCSASLGGAPRPAGSSRSLLLHLDPVRGALVLPVALTLAAYVAKGWIARKSKQAPRDVRRPARAGAAADGQRPARGPGPAPSAGAGDRRARRSGPQGVHARARPGQHRA